MLPMVSGHWYAPFVTAFDNEASAESRTDTITLVPIYVPNEITVTHLVIYISNCDGGTSIPMRLAIYSDTDGKPAALVVETGEYVVNSQGSKSIAINQVLSPGWHWLANLWGTKSGAGSVNLRGFSLTEANECHSLIGEPSGNVFGLTNQSAGYEVGHSYGAFPASIDPGELYTSQEGTGEAVPVMGFHVS